MNEIKEVNAFSVGNKVFATKVLAETYKREMLDEIVLGDTVCIKSFEGGRSQKIGIVYYIENQNEIYFAMGTFPQKFIGEKWANGGFNLLVDGESYTWTNGCHPRKNLIVIRKKLEI